MLMLSVYAAGAVAAAHYLPAQLPAFMDRYLPALVPEIGVDLSLVYGAAALAAFALFHATYMGGRARRMARREVGRLRDDYSEVRRELSIARAEAQQIQGALEAAAVTGPKAQQMREMVNEVKVLQDLVQRISKPPAQIEEQPAEAPDGETPPPGDQTPPPDDKTSSGQKGTDPAPEEPAEDSLEDDDILAIVREGLELDRVDLFLQPVVSLPQRKHRFYEAFSRIRDGSGGMVLPEQYLALAEREGLIAAIDNMLLFRCVQLVRRSQQRNRKVGFFCNISPHTLADTGFFREFIAFMGENRELSANLHFEFSQADVGDMSDETAGQLQQLVELGFHFSLDKVRRLDINYAEISRRGFRFIKLEARNLMDHIAGEELSEDFQNFKTLLNRHDIDLIVEKIESEDELIELLDYEIDFGQGYLFGEPRLARET